MIELYRTDKSLIAQVVEEKGEQRQKIIKDLKLLHKKFDAVCKTVFNLQIIVSSREEE
jgi:hypothetical protein